ncbi:MAG: ATP-binding protein [Daejeonella sp.]
MATNIKKLILEGEGISLDFKNSITSCEKIAKTLVAYANNKGGKLLIGVADDGRIVGVKAEEEEKYMINKAAHLYCKPALEPKFEEIYIDDKIVLVVDIRESEMKPHYSLSEDKKWWVYIRVNDKSVLASKIVVDVLKRSHNEQGVFMQYSTNEDALLKYLNENERITAREFSTMQKLSRRSSYRILVNLILSGLIKIHTNEKEEYYTAS